MVPLLREFCYFNSGNNFLEVDLISVIKRTMKEFPVPSVPGFFIALSSTGVLVCYSTLLCIKLEIITSA